MPTPRRVIVFVVLSAATAAFVLAPYVTRELPATPASIPAVGRASAQHHWRAALAYRAELRIDSALAALRRARRADPDFLPAHWVYIDLTIARGDADVLALEYAPWNAVTPMERCLALVTQHAVTGGVSSLGFARGMADGLATLERRFGASDCTSAYLTRSPEVPSDSPRLLEREIWRGKRAIERSPQHADVWQGHAARLLEAGRRDEAWRVYRRAGATIEDPVERISLLASEARERARLGDSAGARSRDSAAARAVARDARPGLQLAYLATIGHHALQRGPKATLTAVERTALEEAARLAAKYGAWDLEWGIRHGRGRILFDQHGDAAGAWTDLTRAAVIADRSGRRRLQLASYAALGRVEMKMGRAAAAERSLLRASRMGRPVDGPSALLEVHHNLAHTYEAMRRWPEAMQAADAFVRAARVEPGSPARIMSLHDAGMILWKAGLHMAADSLFEEMVQAVDTRRQQFYWAGQYYERRGQLRRAIDYFLLSRAANENLSLTLAGLARSYEALGMADSALLAAREHDGLLLDPADVPLAPELLGRQGRFSEAIAVAESWAGDRQRRGNVKGTVVANLQLARLLLDAAEAPRAVEASARADTLARLANLTEDRSAAERLGGIAAIRSGRVQHGLSLLRSAVRSARREGALGEVASASLALGDALASSGADAAALRAYRDAARAVSIITGRLDDDVALAGYRERHLAPFDRALDMLLRRSGRDQARLFFEWSERRKAAWAQALFSGAADSSRAGDIAVAQARLDRHEVVLDFSVMDTLVAVLAVTRFDAAVHVLPVSTDTLRVWIDRLRRPLVSRVGSYVDAGHMEFDLESARRLYGALLEPVAASFREARAISIVPDGPLHYVPFEALLTAPAPSGDDRYLKASYVLDRWEVSYVPSVGAIARRPGRAERLTAPRIAAFSHEAPGSDEEVAAIQQAWPRAKVTVWSGQRATETRVYAATSADVLHVAAHATADDRDPLASHFRLAADGDNDGLMHVREIADHPSRWRMVVLSGCETLNGRLFAGEGLMSLARAYLLSGARTVVASRWPIGDGAAVITRDLYGGLASGAEPAAALRASMLRTRRTRESAHPFYWAAMAVVSAY